MAQRLSETAKIALTVQTATGDDGKAVTAQRSFSDINPDLLDDDSYTFAVNMGNLQKYPVTKITVTNSAVLGPDD